MNIHDDHNNTDQPFTYSIVVAGQMAGLAKNSAYAAVRRGEIPVITFGGKNRVPGAKWRRMLAEGNKLSAGK
jgi:hypothetical protein